MNTIKVLTLILLIANVSTIENSKKSLKDQLGYNPAELLANIFNPNITTESRESRPNTIQYENDYVDDSEEDGLQTDKQEFKDQILSNKDQDFLIAKPDENNKVKVYIKNNVNGASDSLKLTNKDFWKNYKNLRSDNTDDDDDEGEFRSDFKRRKNKKRNPRVQSTLNQNYPEIGHPLSLNQQGLLSTQYPNPIAPNQFGIAHSVPHLNKYPGYFPYDTFGQFPGYPGAINPFIPRQITSSALSAIVDAFTSIAQNDDYQCVPRLLCETAGGAVGSNKILESVTNLQPLFGMLANYQGLSTTPLFLFGRAVLLGMTSKGNPSSCRYAYPQCPNDPDELVYYLNNHKGGFFRFFNNIKGKPYSGGAENVQSYGLYQSSRTDQNDLSLYNNHKQYSGKDVYNKGNEQTDGAINSNTFARIQNKPANALNDNVIVKTKWLFPDDVRNYDNVRLVKELKFPSYDDSDTDYDFDIKDYKRKEKSIAFPERNDDDRYANKYNYNESYNNNYNRYTDDIKTDYVFDYVHNFYVKREKKTIKSPKDDNGVKTVYIVRGNGDPRYPEVVKLRPGQSIQ